MVRSLSIRRSLILPQIYPAAGGVVLYSLVSSNPAVDGQVILTDPTDPTKMPAIGIVVRVFGDGRVLIEGRKGTLVTNSGWSWTRGNTLWADPATPGGLFEQVAAPPTTGEMQRVGQAASATSIVMGITREIVL